MHRTKQNHRSYSIFAAGLVVGLLCFVVAGCSGIKSAEAEKTPEMIPVLTYHKIVASGVEFENNTLISEDTFDEQMKYLHDKGFTTLTMDEFYDWYKGGDVPEKSVVVTFDDGYYGSYYLAYPILKKYGQAATVFVIGHHVEDTTDEWSEELEPNHYVGRDVINEVRKEYPEFGFESHTFDMHRKIDGKHPVDVFTYDQMIEDINKNAEFSYKYLAYPWGDFNETMQKALADSGYKMAFTYGNNYYATRNDDQYAVNRVKISGKMKLKKFKKIVNLKEKEYISADE